MTDHNIAGRWHPQFTHDAAHRIVVSADSNAALNKMIDDAIHMAVQAARGEERETCAAMARSYARAVSKGSHRKPASAEDWGEAIAKHIEIPF